MRTAPPGILPLVSVDRSSPRPLYQQVYEGYRDAIVERRLRAGQRLPSTRSLAIELRISRIPILNAFEQLLAEGYVEGRIGAGTFVARSLPDEGAGGPGDARMLPKATRRPGARVTARHPAAVASARRDRSEPWLGGLGAFRMNQPAVELFPVPQWSRLLARHARNPDPDRLRYAGPLGYRPFREVVAAYLRTARAVRCDADQIMVVSGSQQALDITARALFDTGSRVWVEEPGYSGAREALVRAGAQLVGVPVDDEGLDVASGIARCPKARAAYVTPTHQYPLGVTMSASRRLHLLDWAERSGAWVIEDDYDSEYRYGSQPVPALQGLDRDARVIYIGTFSKVLFPSLRIGYLVIPRDLVDRFTTVREAMDICPPALFQSVLTEFIEDGLFARHVRRMRQLYRERRGALVDALAREFGASLPVLGEQAGMHLVVTFARELRSRRDRQVADRAAAQALWTMPLSSCYLGKPTRQGLVLGYSGTDVAGLASGVRRLRAVL